MEAIEEGVQAKLPAELRPRFIVVLEAADGDGIHGLRALLKRALRAYGLKCVELREV